MNTNNDTLKGLYKGTIYEDGYGRSPKSLWHDKAISTNAKTLYCFISSYAGSNDTAFPTIAETMQTLKWGRDKYYDSMRELSENGYIYKVQVRNSSGVFNHNEYRLIEQKTEKASLKYKELAKKNIKNAKLPCPENPHTVKNEENTESVENTQVQPCPDLPYTVQPNTADRYINIEEEFKEEETKEEVELFKVIELYKKCITKDITDFEIDTLNKLIDISTFNFVVKAIEYTAMHSKNKTLSYVYTLVTDWTNKGFKSLEQIENYISKRNKENKKQGSGSYSRKSTFDYSGQRNNAVNEYENMASELSNTETDGSGLEEMKKKYPHIFK